MSKLREDALTSTYEDVERLLMSCCHWYLERYRGEWDDIMGECRVAFVEAYDTYDPSRGAFTTWLVLKCKWRLLSYTKKESKEPINTKRDLSPIPDQPERSDAAILLSDLSEDAKAIIRLLFDCPVVKREIATSTTKRLQLADYLRGLGWSWPRILSSFDELES